MRRYGRRGRTYHTLLVAVPVTDQPTGQVLIIQASVDVVELKPSRPIRWSCELLEILLFALKNLLHQLFNQSLKDSGLTLLKIVTIMLQTSQVSYSCCRGYIISYWEVGVTMLHWW